MLLRHILPVPPRHVLELLAGIHALTDANGLEVSTLVLTWSRAMGEFGATLMLVGVTRMKTETLPGSIYLNISTGDNGMAMAAATIMLLIACSTLILTNLLNRSPKYYRSEEVVN